MKQKLAALTCVLLILSGCARGGGSDAVSITETGSGDVTGQEARGRYVETPVEPPPVPEDARFQRLAASGDGFDILYAGSGRLYRYHSADGNQWEERDAALLSAPPKTDPPMDYAGFGQAADGAYYLAGNTYEAESIKVSMYRSVSGQTWEAVPLDWDAASGLTGNPLLFATSLQVGADGSLYIGDFNAGALLRVSAEGEALNAYPLRFPALLSGRAAEYRSETNEIVFFDLQTGEELDPVPVSGSLGVKTEFPLLSAGPDDALYLATTGGVARLAPGGSLFEQMIDGSACSLGDPSAEIRGAAPGKDGSFLVCLKDSGGTDRLLRYVYDPDMPSRPDQTIRVAALTDQPTLRQAAIRFQLDHPETQVDVRTMLDGEGGVTAADAVRTLNTELLAGNGPDVLALDALPLQSYIEKGVLADLSDTVGPMLESGELLPNIAGALKTDQGLFCVPARFSVPMLASLPENAPQAAALSALGEAARAAPDRRLLYNLAPDALLKLFYPSCSPGLLSEDGSLDADALAAFLTDLKSLAENTGGQDFTHDTDNIFGDEAPAELPDWVYDAAAPVRFAFGKTEFLPFTLASFRDMRLPYAAVRERSGGALSPEEAAGAIVPLPGIRGKAFAPSCILGVNASGARTDLASAFVAAALSQPVQDAVLGDGLAVRAASLESSVDTDVNSSASYKSPEGDASLRVECTPPEAQAVLLETLRALDTPFLRNDTLYGFIEQEAGAFFDGARSAPEAARAIAERTAAYLAE